MVDFIHLPPFPARFAEPLRASVNGAKAMWPESISDDESRLIETHGMLPVVYAYSGISSLHDAALRAAAVEALRLADLREVLAALREKRVQPLIVKGTALAYSIYDAPELRPRGDTDLLIDENEIDAVRDALTPLGFRAFDERRRSRGAAAIVRARRSIRRRACVRRSSRYRESRSGC